MTHAGQTHALTRRGLYTVLPSNTPGRLAKFERLTDFPGYFWDMTEAGPSLFVSGFGGVWRIDDGKVNYEHQVSADVFAIAPNPQQPSSLVMMEGSTLRSLSPSPNGGWAAHDLWSTPATHRFRWSRTRISGSPPLDPACFNWA